MMRIRKTGSGSGRVRKSSELHQLEWQINSGIVCTAASASWRIHRLT